METKKELVDAIKASLTRKGTDNEREFVTVALQKGDKVTFTKIGEGQTFNDFQWFPVEDNAGHRISIQKLVYGRNLQFKSNRIDDRIDAIVAAVDSAKGLPLTVSDITERDVLDTNGAVVIGANGVAQKSKVYAFSNEMVG